MVGTALLQPVLDLYTVIKIHVYYKHLSFIVIFQNKQHNHGEKVHIQCVC